MRHCLRGMLFAALLVSLAACLSRSDGVPQAQAAVALSVTWRAAVYVPVTFSGLPETGYEADVDLRPQIRARGLHIRNQGNRGTCTVFATTFLIEYQYAAVSRQTDVALSEEYLNWAANRVNGKPFYDGGMFTKMIPGFDAWGVSTSKEMPYRQAYDPNAPDRPSAAATSAAKSMFPTRYPFVTLKVWNDQDGMTGAELQAVQATLRSGRPVATGIWWLNNFSTVNVHGIPLIKDYPRSANTGANPPMFDGHSIDLVGFKTSSVFPGGGYFIFRNSFGKSWGDHGYGFVSFQFMRTYANDAIAIAPQPWTARLAPNSQPKI